MGSVKLEKVTRVDYFKRPDFKKEDVKKTLDKVVEIVDHMLEKFHDDVFPSAASKNYEYEAVGNLIWNKDNNASIWTTSFWTGILWLVYEYTKDDKYKIEAQKHSESFRQRIDNYYNKDREEAGLDHHDIGFLYSLTVVADYKLTGSKRALETAIKAAEILDKRYIDTAKIFQAWGDMNDENQRGRMIIDCNLNLPLLYFVDKYVPEKKYHEKAYNHVKQAMKYIVREDASTFHTYFMDIITGKPRFGSTHQGYSDDSCWARGQAWGMMGFPLSYKYTKDYELIELAKKLANYFLNRLPKDFICNWDLIFQEEDGQRDTSAAAVAAIGLSEMLKYIPLSDESRLIYENACLNITKSLIDNYIGTNKEGILKSGVYFYKGNLGIDEYLIFGDYFFVELLMRLYKDWESYW